MKKPKQKSMEELTKGFDEFVRNNETNQISREQFEKGLKKVSTGSKSPRKS